MNILDSGDDPEFCQKVRSYRIYWWIYYTPIYLGKEEGMIKETSAEIQTEIKTENRRKFQLVGKKHTCLLCFLFP